MAKSTLATWHRKLVSGETRGISASLERAALHLAEWPYAAAVAIRNAYYDFVPGAICRIGRPVIGVGNLTVGGTGKSPCAAMIAKWLMAEGLRVAVVSRGYGAHGYGPNDEMLEMATSLPEVLVQSQPDRVKAARSIEQQDAADVILLDDGFQHRRLHRDLNLLVIDALQPDGYGHLIPRGLLREPLKSARRADALLLNRCDGLSPGEREVLRASFQRYAKRACWAEVAERPLHLQCANGSMESLDSWRGRPVAAFCGIGNPEGFRRTLSQTGLQCIAFREFPDHHHYSASDFAELANWLAGLPTVTAVVCTRKDQVKIPHSHIHQWPLFGLAMEIVFRVGEQEVHNLVQNAVRRKGCQVPKSDSFRPRMHPLES